MLRSWLCRPQSPDQEASSLVEAGALLLDVRTREEFASGHVPGALNIPIQELANRVTELKHPERQLVVYCRSGARSAAAAELLKAAGFDRVHDMGAMSNWRD